MTDAAMTEIHWKGRRLGNAEHKRQVDFINKEYSLAPCNSSRLCCCSFTGGPKMRKSTGVIQHSVHTEN